MNKIDFINFSSIDEIKNRFSILEDDDYGFNSTLYYYTNNKLLKLLKTSMDEYMLDILKYMKDLDTKTVVNMEELIKVRDIIYGYTLMFKKGKNLTQLNDKTNLIDYFNSIKLLEDDIKYLSKNNVIMHDLKDHNILYDNNTNEINIIDIDFYYLDEISSYEMKLIYNLQNLYNAIFDSLIKSIFDNKVNDDLYEQLFSYFKSNSYKDSIDIFFINLLERIENISNQEIITLNDFKKVFCLKKDN